MADCIDKILKVCGNSEVKKYRALIKLMQNLDKEITNAIRIRNCLILLVNLCFNPNSPDYAYNKGKSPKVLTGEERTKMQELLRCEFNN